MRKRNQLRGQIERYLTEFAPARERSNRHRALRDFVSKIHPELLNIDKEKMLNCIDLFLSSDRMIRRVQQEDKKYRGSDYDETKQILEEEAQISLGYGS